METGAVLRHLAWSTLIVIASACSDPPSGPTDPWQVTTPFEPRAAMKTFTVSNGWTREPVAGALVSANGAQAETDTAGQVRLPVTGACLKVELSVPGFLERRTCSSGEITLWPVANEREREATRIAAFNQDRLYGGPPVVLPELALAEELQARADAVQTWTFAAAEIHRLTANGLSLWPFHSPESVLNTPDWGFVISPVAARPTCRFPVPWSFETVGFCVEHTGPGYFAYTTHVLEDRLTDPIIALRALLYISTILKPHDMPGLLNRSRPDGELSAFERKTLHMIGLRRPVTLEWPDLEP
jgi:hypothetical protein